MDDRTAVPRTAGVIAPLGVVFGDIGTSPLYAASTTFKTVRQAGGGAEAAVYGGTSLLIWTLTLIVTVLYVGVLMRTDNHGEGGLLALFGLVRGGRLTKRALGALTVLAMFGAAMFFGDSVITPAISVLSAVEGLTALGSSFSPFVLPVAIAVLVVVFAIQRFGSSSIGRLFGPVMLVWFAVLALLGVVGVVRDPAVLVALSPHWAVLFAIAHPLVAFLSLGGVVLAVTGAEALYADLGHFGRRSITRAWAWLVFPALVLNYLGQAATTLQHGAGSFYDLVPGWALVPAVVLATLATVIASQAVISGAFSVVHQASGLGFLPPLRLVHTSRRTAGQIYIPAVNLLMAVAVLGVTIGFRTSDALASAYGIAVTATISVTTIVYLTWRRSARQGVGVRGVVAAAALVLVLLLLAANVPKVVSGGWLPLLIGAVILTITLVWRTGKRRMRDALRSQETELDRIGGIIGHAGEELRRVPGDGVFVAGAVPLVPVAFSSMVDRIHALPDRAVIVDWAVSNSPTTRGEEDRVTVRPLDGGVLHVHARLGFRDRPRAAAFVAAAARRRPDLLDGFDAEEATFFVSDPVPTRGRRGRMPGWAQRVFLALDRVAPDPTDLMDLPRDRTIVLGREVPL